MGKNLKKRIRNIVIFPLALILMLSSVTVFASAEENNSPASSQGPLSQEREVGIQQIMRGGGCR